ncbi:MAG: triose-phosphate isomerase [Deltaproteobacteria bacterium]|nr:triose-phosphate isomerase [Deltaproteobacteria bacterium]
MNCTIAESLDLASKLRDVLGGLRDIEVGISPPFTALSEVVKRVQDSDLIVAAQHCHVEDGGAFTGETSIPMIADLGCSHVLLGHSERRQYFGEDDRGVNAKAKKVLAAGMRPVICIGERLSEREANQTFEVVGRQLAGALEGLPASVAEQIVVAYEPVWAIGTGKTASTAQAQEVHGFLRGQLLEILGAEAGATVRIQYGGSVKPENISGLMAQPDVDGALVGGASLNAESFIGILKYDRQA